MNDRRFKISGFFKFLLSRFADEEMIFSISEDLESRFKKIAADKGTFQARISNVWQIISLLSSFIIESLIWRMTMVKSYFKLGFRQLKRRKLYSSINILGLTIGIACFFLIGLWVQDELSYDRFHHKKDRLFRVMNKLENGLYAASITYALAPTLKSDYPEIEEYSRVWPWHGSLIKYRDKSFEENDIYLADPGFFKMFFFPFLRGNPDTALRDKNAIVLTEEMAQKYFGKDDPIGQTLYMGSHDADFTVTGVIQNIPNNSHMQFDMIARVELLGDARLARWNEWVAFCYVLLRPGVSSPDFTSKIADIYKKNVDPEVTYTPYLHPLTKVHLYEFGRPGRVKKVYIFSLIAGFILLMACINFMNLSTARSAQRAMEVGMRKVIGASRTQVIRQFLGESVFLTFLSLLLALILVEAVLPAFNLFTGKTLTLLASANISLILTLVLLAIMIGLFAGSYPALFLSSFQPAQTLKNTLGFGNKGSAVRKILLVFQFAISVCLITCTLIVSKQLHFIQNRDLGLDREHVVILNNNPTLMKRYDEFKNELLFKPGILHMSAAMKLPTEIGQSIRIDWEGNQEDNLLGVDYTVADYDYVETFDMEILQGRSFSKEFATDIDSACIINESATRLMGLDMPIGKNIIMVHSAWERSFRNARIIGVVKDFHARSFHNNIRPFVMRIYRPWHQNIFIKIQGSQTLETLKHIKYVFKTYAPDYPFSFEFMDEAFNRQYSSEHQLNSLFNWFSLLSIFIACLGLFGLASYMVEQRTKEIGIRKVLGASIAGILLMLSKDFIKWVVIAACVAWPIAYYMMYNWLRNFAYKTDISFWILFLAGGAATGMALLTISFQAIRASKGDPIKALRHE